jgi:hypothetical protein
LNANNGIVTATDSDALAAAAAILAVRAIGFCVAGGRWPLTCAHVAQL